MTDVARMTHMIEIKPLLVSSEAEKNGRLLARVGVPTPPPPGGCVVGTLLGPLGGKTQRVPPRAPLPLISVRPKPSTAPDSRNQVISRKVGDLPRISQRWPKQTQQSPRGATLPGATSVV